MSEIKEQNRITIKELNETEIRNMPDKDFKVMVIKIFTWFEKRADKLQ